MDDVTLERSLLEQELKQVADSGLWAVPAEVSPRVTVAWSPVCWCRVELRPREYQALPTFDLVD